MSMKAGRWLIGIFCLGLTFPGVAQEKEGQADPKGGHVVYSMKSVLPVYQEKAEKGDVEAQLMMGQIYAMGDIVKADMGKAFSWFMKAAAQGNAEAQFKLAEMYLYGQGVERDLAQAKKWAIESAKQEYADGEYFLGFLYAEGKGVPEDWRKALVWLCLAAGKNNQKAIDLLQTRTFTGGISSGEEGEGVKDWCNCSSGRLAGC